MKADVDGDDDDDDRGGVSGRPGMRVGDAADFHAYLPRSPLLIRAASSSAVSVGLPGDAKPRVDSRGVPYLLAARWPR